MLGADGACRVDRDTQRRRGRAGIAGRIGRRGGEAVIAIRRRRGGETPGAAAVGRHRCQAGSCRHTPSLCCWPVLYRSAQWYCRW